MTIMRCVAYHSDLRGTLTFNLKVKYLTLRSKVKVPQRSIRYATHRLMVMHPHTKYHWPISKEKNVMAWTRKYYLKNNYLTLRSKSHKGHYGMQHTALWSCTHIFFFRDRSMIFGMRVHDHKTVCRIPYWPLWDLDLWPQGQIIVFKIVFIWYVGAWP
jgi:hypothetical protein